MPKIAYLFPGQGSQYLGMGYDLFKEYDFVREIFDAADEIVKQNISKLCFKGPVEVLSKTLNLQPAITAVNLACLAAINKEGGHCNVAMGHSLGEYSALKAANILTLSDTMRTVSIRGCFMDRESIKYNGKMCALIGIGFETVKSIIRKCKVEDTVSIASYNTKNQITISGVPTSVDKIISELSISSPRSVRVIPLKVSGAWHSNLMMNAKSDFKIFLESIKFSNPECKVIYNVNADTTFDVEEIKVFLVNQMCGTVLWYDSICKLVNEGIEIFVELGPGRVLTGLIKKILPRGHNCKVFNVSCMVTLEKFLRDIY